MTTVITGVYQTVVIIGGWREKNLKLLKFVQRKIAANGWLYG